MSLISQNPATEEIMNTYKYLTFSSASNEVKKINLEAKNWAKTDFSERSRFLKKLADQLKKNSSKYGKLITLEMGKPIKQAVAEVEKSALACEYYAENAEKFLADQVVKTDAKKSLVTFEPLGTILGIMPWNFPFWQVFRFAAATLAAGNAVVVKHASNVPQCAFAIEEAFNEANFPKVYKNLPIDGKMAQQIIERDLIEGVSLTGSTEAGVRVGEIAGKTLKKCVLELGGMDPYIVLSGANLEKAAEQAVNARFQNCGQSCISAKRFIIENAIYEDFKRLFLEKTQKLIIGDPIDEKTTLGPLARADLRDEVVKLLNQGKKNGGKVLCGGKIPNQKGFFLEPTILEVSNHSIIQEEVFGPVATLINAKNSDEAISIANDSQFGLGASIWGEETEAEKVARSLACGSVAINSMHRSDPRMPFGGLKKSGLGRELGNFGILEFVNVKAISVF